MSIALIKTKLQGVQVIELDTATQLTYQYPSKVTQFPIETGESISDHVINENFMLSIEGLISDSDIRITDNSGSRARNAFEALLALRESKQPFTVVTGLKSYDNLLFTEFDISLNSESGDALPIRLTLAQVHIVSSQSVFLPAPNTSGDTQDRAANQANQGDQEAVPKEQSELKGIVNNVGWFSGR